MKLEWLGHAAFRLEGADGLAVVTDPYTPETAGYRPIEAPADVVIVSSSDDLFHCRADLVPGRDGKAPLAVDAHAVAKAQFTGQGATRILPRSRPAAISPPLTVECCLAAEWELHPSGRPGDNGMYRFVLDGVSVGHMGDIGNPPTPEQMAFFEGVDVLLALAGGPPTMALPDVRRLVEHARPRMVVPMHFRTLSYRPRNIAWVAEFVALFGEDATDFPCASAIEITPDTLPEPTRVVVLNHSH